ncbi:MAG: enoyl-CoA hydratase/isomerase family protein [Chloroflexi bacterium]|nr:enoyl-CoA hydratase/isomerase family protein [Chloroflexota bacterium]
MVQSRPTRRPAVELREILYEVGDDGVAVITLNRPEKMNSFTSRMIEEWAWAIEQAREDAAVRAVIVTGAGGRAFCAGMDVQQEAAGEGVLQTNTGPAARRNSLRYNVHKVPRALALLDKPYIAAVNGAAVGAGMDMASMADMRFAADTARFGMAYVRMGIIPGDAGAFFLPRLVGLAKALELIWTGDIFTAPRALEWGYVSRVVPADKLMEETRAFAARLAEGPGVAIQLAKRLVYRSLETDLDHALDLAQSAMIIAQSTEDAVEGPRAFVEKRQPAFQSR